MNVAEIIAVGSELLTGGRTDTNSVFLSDLLLNLGIPVRYKTVVGDNESDICRALAVASRRANVVLVTGGLGPTIDDVTREAVSRLTQRKLRRRPAIQERIRERLSSQGRVISEYQFRQAELPVGADCLENSAGTAPGFSVKWKGGRIFCLPGVSHEARQVFIDGVQFLLKKEGLVFSSISNRAIHTFGIPEGDVDAAIRELLPSLEQFQVGLLASPLGVSVSITKNTRNALNYVKNNKNNLLNEESKDLLDFIVSEISSKLQPNVYGFDHEKMEDIVGSQLCNLGYSISLAESCTGGLIGHRLTQVSGSSSYFDRGIVCYSNQAKVSELGVPQQLLRKYGAVSPQVAHSMAVGVRKKSQTQIGLSVTGVAGPKGGTPSKPVGLVFVGLSTPTGTFTKKFRFHGTREMVKLRSSQGALDVLRRYLGGLAIV